MNKEYLITGGSGTLGKTMLKYLLKNKKVKGIRVYSRGEILQEKIRKDLKQEFGKDIPVSFLIGDVRDKDRLKMALKGVDICIHAAAMKIVPTAENDPIECIKTNIIGSSNVIEAAIECGVKKVMGISTDKACSPENLYGATKMCMEKLFLNSRVYSADKKTKFSVCRYGNVLGSRGSIIPLFKKQYKDTGKITITHKDMTRFWITPENAIKFILGAIDDMRGNEIFVPVMSSAKVLDIAQAIVPDAEYEEIGVRPGEKLHECLISESESQKCWENIARKYFIISDRFKKSCKDKTSFEYRSDSNTKWLNQKQIKEMIGG